MRLALAVTFRVFGILLVLVIATGGYFVWRLSRGPIDVDFLRPALEATLSQKERGLAVELGGVQIGYDPNTHALDLAARDVRLRGDEGQLLAAVPEVALGLSLRAAFKGVIAPTRIVVREPHVRIRRDEDGAWKIGVVAGDGEGDLAGGLLDLLQPPTDDRSLGQLREVAVRNATLDVDDRMVGLSWSARRGAATLFRTDRGFKGDATFAADLGGRESELRLDYSFAAEGKRLDAELGFADLEPSRIAALATELQPLTTVKAPVGGWVRFAATLDPFRLEGGRAELTMRSGIIARPELPTGILAVRGGTLKADYDPAGPRINLIEADVDLYGPTVALTGTVDGLDLHKLLFSGGTEPAVATAMAINAEVVAKDVPVNTLDGLWPTALGKGARSWVLENVRDGIAEEGRVALRVGAPALLGPFEVEHLGGTLRYRDLTVHYRRPLPPVRGVAGTATFDRAKFELTPTAGSLMGLRVAKAIVSLTALDTDNERASIDVQVTGPIRDALAVIDTKPFEYAKEIGIDPARTSGTAEARLAFRFPLARDLSFEQVELKVQARLAAATIKQFLFKSDLTDGGFDLDLDRGGVRLQGGAKLAGIPAAASVAHLFGKPKDNVRTRATVWARIDREGRQRLDLDVLPDMLDGPVGADVSYAALADKRADLSVTLDLKDAILREPLLGYEKPAGTLGAAKLDIDLREDRILRIRDLVVKSTRLDVRGTVAFNDRQDVQRIELKRLVAGETDVSGAATRSAEGAWRIEFGGLSYDASAIVKDSSKPDDPAKDKPPPLVIEAKVGRLVVGEKREARNVSLQLSGDRLHWQMARMDGELIGGGRMSLRFGAAGGGRPFNFTSDNFGAVVQLLGITDSIASGHVDVKGAAEDDGPRRTFRGHVEAADYRLVRAPAFAKLLSLASLTSLSSLLAGEGLPFTRLGGDFASSEGKLELKDLHAYGGALGINVSGLVDLSNDTIDVQGTIVPAYTINSILGYVPLLGKLLLGGEGQGLFAANFRATGPIDDPRISVNPLSALAPGFLRRLFVFDAVDPGSGTPTNEPLQKQDR
jgi:uncharacterized protein YhdP